MFYLFDFKFSTIKKALPEQYRSELRILGTIKIYGEG